jgi:hypothetical protein
MTGSVGTGLSNLWHGGLEEFLEPALAGFGVAIVFFAIDSVSGAGSQHFEEFVKGAASHAKAGYVLTAFWFGAISLLVAGSPLQGALRPFVRPVLRFGHHLGMLAFGAFFALVCFGKIDFWGGTLGAAWVGLILFCVSGELFVLEWFITHGLHRVRRFVSWQAFVLLAGIAATVALSLSYRHERATDNAVTKEKLEASSGTQVEPH